MRPRSRFEVANASTKPRDARLEWPESVRNRGRVEARPDSGLYWAMFICLFPMLTCSAGITSRRTVARVRTIVNRQPGHDASCSDHATTRLSENERSVQLLHPTIPWTHSTPVEAQLSCRAHQVRRTVCKAYRGIAVGIIVWGLFAVWQRSRENPDVATDLMRSLHMAEPGFVSLERAANVSEDADEEAPSQGFANRQAKSVTA